MKDAISECSMGAEDGIREARRLLVRLIRARENQLEQWDVELKFPVEFAIERTPVSFQSRNSTSKESWKQQVKEAARDAVGHSTWATTSPVFVTIYYFPFGPMQGDVDNIVKLIIDGMIGPIYVDDRQIQRVIVQKFESDGLFEVDDPTPALASVIESEPPVVYIRIDDAGSVDERAHD